MIENITELTTDDAKKASRQAILALRTWRKNQAITQQEVADEMNITQNTVSEFENKDDCYLSTLIRYANAVDCKLTITLQPKEF